MGAVSALGDMNTPEATHALLERLHDLNKTNQQLAIKALLRSEDRKLALSDAIDTKKVSLETLSAEEQKLLSSPSQ